MNATIIKPIISFVDIFKLENHFMKYTLLSLYIQY
jgi:hypothetical protein